jgi:hypothetical protein
MRVYSNQLLTWRGNLLHLGRCKLAEIVQDDRYPTMWRVRRADGTLSDMLNLTRARDAARGMALGILNGQERRALAAHSAF